jgi:excisionase family DNA binding protein
MTTTDTPPTAVPGRLLDYHEVADWLHTSVRHLRRLVDEDRIPYLKVGHYIRFDRDKVREWLEDNNHGPAK